MAIGWKKTIAEYGGDMKEIDEALKQTESDKRRDYLTQQLNKLGIYRAKDGRHFNWLELAELEDLHISAKNDAARAYGER